MSPRHHFADYQKRDPKGYQTFSDSLWNGFVSITHKIGLNRFFSFTPEFLGDEIDYEDPQAAQALGEALGEIYAFSHGIPIDPFDTPKSL